MNNIDKLVSVIVPVFNRQQLILETIDSVINQTYKNWELIIIDDNSTDNTFSLLQKASALEKRIKIFKRDRLPKGAPVCRNIGLEKASGDFLIFLDSDDTLLFNCIENRVSIFEKNLSCDLIIFYGAFFTNTINDASVLWNKFDGRDDLKRFLMGEAVWSISGPIWKTDFIKQNNLKFDETAPTSQDWEFHVKALFKKPVYIKYTSIPDYFIRRNPLYNTISAGHWSENKIFKRIELYENIFDKLITERNTDYKSQLIITILKEYKYLLLKKNIFQVNNLLALKKRLGTISWNIKFGFFYILTGNKLLKVNSTIFKWFSKACEILFATAIFSHNSNYRTAMSTDEIQMLNNILKSKRN